MSDKGKKPIQKPQKPDINKGRQSVPLRESGNAKQGKPPVDKLPPIKKKS